MAEYLVPFNDEWVTETSDDAETKETFGGFAAVDVPDEAAARYRAGIAVACDWPQEVRIFRRPGRVPTPDADRAGLTATEA